MQLPFLFPTFVHMDLCLNNHKMLSVFRVIHFTLLDVLVLNIIENLVSFLYAANVGMVL